MNCQEHVFFRGAVLRICSSLDIEKIMYRLVRHLKKVMPADQLILNFYDPRLNALRTKARATCERGFKEDLLIPMAPHIDLPSAIRSMPRVSMCNDTKEDHINDSMAKAYGMEDYSLLQMFLETGEHKFGLGHLTLCAKGKNQYTTAHLNLFALLREPFTLASANVIQQHQILEIQHVLEDDRRYFQNELRHQTGDTIIGLNHGLKPVMTKVRQVASKMSPVLITGETGVGKDVIANMIHALSGRRNNAFIKVNCGAIPDTLIDSELFGHEKGAFTGAVSKKRGRFERAHKGTIFLDEIGELPPHAQVRLLRILQNKEIERVGGSELLHVDIRVIAATNKNLEKHVNTGDFRKDLWYRLNVFPIHIPPLRQRKTDIVPLANHFIQAKSNELQLPDSSRLAPGTIDRLMEYHWPGNVRELQNLIERALIVNEGQDLEMDPFPNPSQKTPDPPQTEMSGPLRIDDVNIRHIERVLEMTGGKIHGPGGAAELLDINAGTLRNRMKKLGIKFGRNRKRPGDPPNILIR